MFQAIAHGDLTSLDKLAQLFIKGNRNSVALLALDHFFSCLPVLQFYNSQEMTLFLAKFLEYVRLLNFIISHPSPLSMSSIRKLFCITEVSNTGYRLDIGSFLYNSATVDRDRPLYRQISTISLSKHGMVSTLRKYLAAHLCERVSEENNLCCKSSVFSQCLTFIVYGGRCNRASCPREHAELAHLDSKRYNVRLGIHLQQITILQLMYSVNPYAPYKRPVCVMSRSYCVGDVLKII